MHRSRATLRRCRWVESTARQYNLDPTLRKRGQLRKFPILPIGNSIQTTGLSFGRSRPAAHPPTEQPIHGTLRRVSVTIDCDNSPKTKVDLPLLHKAASDSHLCASVGNAWINIRDELDRLSIPCLPRHWPQRAKHQLQRGQVRSWNTNYQAICLRDLYPCM